MIKEEIRKQVSELCVDAIINCIREKTIWGSKYPFSKINTNINNEVEIMRYYWALTEDIEEIAKKIIKNARKLTHGIAYVEIMKRGEITGAINAGATMIAQARMLDPTIFVINEPNSTFQSEPNHLVAWLLKEAFNILLTARRVYPTLDGFEWFQDKLFFLEKALKNDILREILLSPLGKRKPSKSAIRLASKSRVALYQKALNAYNMLDRIERKEDLAIRECLEHSLIADLDYWQQLELGVGVKAASAISDIIEEPISFNFPFRPGEPIAQIGNFQVFWQYTIPQRPCDKLDLNEKWTKEIANGLGIKTPNSRADIVVVCESREVCVFECKYSESEEVPTQIIVEAISQLVRYVRDLNQDSIENAKKLLNYCFIVVANCNKHSPINSISTGLCGVKSNVYFSDIKNIRGNSLRKWAEELVVMVREHYF